MNRTLPRALRCGRRRKAIRRLWLTAITFVWSNGSIAEPGALERWRLSIEGHRTFAFGDQRLSAGLRMSWRGEIRFVIRDGQFLSGQGEMAWVAPAEEHSHPPQWFDCRLSDGTFLDRHLNLRDTPWVRYPKFRVSGQVNDRELLLRPALSLPGNFVAVTYHCETDNPIAENWFAFAARARQEGGFRQDAVTGRDGDHRWAEIKELRLIPPRSTLSLALPLREGQVLAIGDRDTLDRTEYRLQRLP